MTDPLLGMMLICVFTLAGGAATGSFLLNFVDKKKLDQHADSTAALFTLAMFVAFVAANYTVSAILLVIAVFFGGMSLADSKPEESK